MKKLINKTIVFFALAVMSTAGLSLPTQVLAETRYVSDELKVPMRSGGSNKQAHARLLDDRACRLYPPGHLLRHRQGILGGTVLRAYLHCRGCRCLWDRHTTEQARVRGRKPV